MEPYLMDYFRFMRRGDTTKLMDTNSASALYQYMTQISDGVTIGADGKIN